MCVLPEIEGERTDDLPFKIEILELGSQVSIVSIFGVFMRSPFCGFTVSSLTEKRVERPERKLTGARKYIHSDRADE